MDGLEWKRSKYSKKVQAFLKMAEAWAARHGDSLIADSPGIQQYLWEKYRKHSTYIPYGAGIYEHPDPTVLSRYELIAEGYHLLIARMEPENNIETIIQGYLASGDERPLVIVGNTSNAFGSRMKELYGDKKGVRFPGAIYDAGVINALRYYAHLYYHGHSVGGTNPSLLEAMGCRARIVAHRNAFNKAVLGDDAFYFSDAPELKDVIQSAGEKAAQSAWLDANIQKIKDTFNWPAVVNAYEQVMLAAHQARKTK